MLGLDVDLTTLLPNDRTTLLSYFLTILPSYHLTQVLGLDVDDLNRLEQVTKIMSK